MKRRWRAFQCRVLSKHRWQEIRIEGEKAFECRDCRKRFFAQPPGPPSGVDILGVGGTGG